MKSKPECLNLLDVARRFRTKRISRVAQFISKFPWKSFLIQAPQVTADIWGVGLQLGGIMGMMAEEMYGAVRRLRGQTVIRRGPPPSDALSKALRYLGSGSPGWTGGGWLSYEDHWLLLAADVVATSVVMQYFTADQFDASIDLWMDERFAYDEPWQPATVDFLRQQGWRPGGPYHPPYPGLGFDATFRQVLAEEARRFPDFLLEAREDFPASNSAAVFQYAAADQAERLLSWGTGEETIGAPVFDPYELVLGRMFEFGVLPWVGTPDESIDFFILRSLAIARAGGRDLPRRGEMILAANEVWGGHREE